MRLLAHQKEATCDCWHTPECSHYKSKSGCTWRDTRKFLHTSKAGEEKHGKRTIATTSDETKEFNCVLSGGHTATFSVRWLLRKLGGPPRKKQFRVRVCRNAEKHFRTREREGPSQGSIQRRPSNVVKNRHEQQRWNCTQQCTKSAGRAKKTRILLKNKDCCKTYFPDRSQP